MQLHHEHYALALAFALAFAASGSSAQTAEAATADAAAPAAPLSAGPAVGDATRNLLKAQRSTGGPARPIPGDVATLSYQRYLDSFKHPIPVISGSTVKPAGSTR